MHTPSSNHSKQPIDDIQNKHLQKLQQLNNFIQKLRIRFQKQVQIIQEAKLTQYKYQLLKTKGQFDQMKQTRNDNTIKKTIKIQKKQMQKQCADFLQKSIQVSKIHNNLKTKLITMKQTQQQLQHQIKYLNKQIKNTINKKQYLVKQLKGMQKWYQAYKEDKDNKDNKGKQNNISILGQRSINLLTNTQKSQSDPSEIQNILNRTKKWQKSRQERLYNKIQNTKQFLNSLVFQQSTLQQIFSLHDPKCYKDDRKKITLMENLLSQKHVKKQLFALLFEAQNN